MAFVQKKTIIDSLVDRLFNACRSYRLARAYGASPKKARKAFFTSLFSSPHDATN